MKKVKSLDDCYCYEGYPNEYEEDYYEQEEEDEETYYDAFDYQTQRQITQINISISEAKEKFLKKKKMSDFDKIILMTYFVYWAKRFYDERIHNDLLEKLEDYDNITMQGLEEVLELMKDVGLDPM